MNVDESPITPSRYGIKAIPTLLFFNGGKLVDQICGSVLWKQSMEWFLENGYDHFVEVGPKKVLRGLMRRIDRKAVVHNVEDSATLTAFLQANGAA